MWKIRSANLIEYFAVHFWENPFIQQCLIEHLLSVGHFLAACDISMNIVDKACWPCKAHILVGGKKTIKYNKLILSGELWQEGKS